MRLRSHPGATRDFNLALDWYIAEAGKPSAARFVEEVEHLRSLILQNPRIGTPGPYDTRSFAFKRFPYTLIYRIRGDMLEVLALAHHRRQAVVLGEARLKTRVTPDEPSSRR